jgi:glutamyl-tRNA synthetase
MRFLTRQHPFTFSFTPDLDRMPCSMFTSVKYIEKIILALQGRLVTLMDLPTAAPYFFVPPAWDNAEARAMLDGISLADYRATMQGTAARLRSTSWEDVSALADVLHAENRAAGIKLARFMTALRHAMSGMKVRPLGSRL